MRLTAWVLVFALLAGVMGCQSGRSGREPRYETISADPHHDTEAARRANALGVQVLRAGEYETAEKQFKIALLADSSFGPAHNNLGIVHFANRRFYEAAWEFQYAAALMSNKAEPVNNLGLVYESVGRLQDAAKAYEDALKLDPDTAEVAGNLARVYLRVNRKDDRTRQLLNVVALRDTRPIWAAWAREQLAVMGSAEPAQPITPPPDTP
jgi:Flp pilus assembly protein TadD